MNAPTFLPKCAACGDSLFTAGDVDPSQIKHDDVTVCLHCGAFQVFSADLTLRPAIDEDIKQLKIDEEA